MIINTVFIRKVTVNFRTKQHSTFIPCEDDTVLNVEQFEHLTQMPPNR